MKKSVKNKPAFTLIEILIALAIFSFVLVLVTSIFSSVLGNQTLISASSVVNRESQRIMRQINDDIIEATGRGEIVYNHNNQVYSDYVEGIIFFDADFRIIEPEDLPQYIDNEDTDEKKINQAGSVADGIALFSGSEITVYRFKAKTLPSVDIDGFKIGNIEQAVIKGNKLTIDNNKKIITLMDFKELNSDKTEIKLLKFWGSACHNVNCPISPIVKISMRLQTKDYNSSSPNKRLTFGLKSTVSKRTYE
jgi:prepilin-type N-terminal cleavage/methylation domain-containing protein